MEHMNYAPAGRKPASKNRAALFVLAYRSGVGYKRRPLIVRNNPRAGLRLKEKTMMTLKKMCAGAGMIAMTVGLTVIAAEPPAAVPAVASPPLPSPLSPAMETAATDVVMVDVDGVKLMKSEMDAQVEQLRAMAGSSVPPDILEQRLKRERRNMAEGFVIKTLLTREADKQKLPVSEKEIDDAIELVKSRLPAGATLEQAMQARKMTMDDLRKNLALELKLKKMVEAQVSTNQAPGEAEARKFYLEEKERFQMPESSHARHILIKVESGDGVKEKAVKKAKAEELRAKLLAGADFAALAKENSDCPSGVKSGGDLGTFARGQMVPPFENAAFTQPTNQIGPIVETTFGYHIIQVLDRAPEKTLTFEETKADIIRGLKMKGEQEAVQEYLKGLKDKAKITYDDSVKPITENPAEQFMKSRSTQPRPMTMPRATKALPVTPEASPAKK